MSVGGQNCAWIARMDDRITSVIRPETRYPSSFAANMKYSPCLRDTRGLALRFMLEPFQICGTHAYS
jgi:hypothetical protein